MRSFNVPIIYRSPLISAIKNYRKNADKLKKDFTPTVLNTGNATFYLARHFGFCYGVENAIEIAFKTIEANPTKRIFLLSEMIHNPQVNNNLLALGVQFLQDTYGNQIIPFNNLTANDIVIIPAFGTTIKIENILKNIGVAIENYNTTCPFVEKVWNRGQALAKKGYTLIIHGKPTHEETRATFSQTAQHTAAVIVTNLKETELLAEYIKGNKTQQQFEIDFKDRYSNGFNIAEHLTAVGVINQTTMLAEDTQEIANYIKDVVVKHYRVNNEHVKDFVADTKDTLCYATNDNQTAVKVLLETEADFAIVVGGYNSSNTSHLVELAELKLPTYYIEAAEKIIDQVNIRCYNMHYKIEQTKSNWLPNKPHLKILITSGASCPDAVVEGVIEKIMGYTNAVKTLNDLTLQFN